MIYKKYLRPYLFKLDSETAHDRIVNGMRVANRIPFLMPAIAGHYRVQDPRLNVKIMGLDFENPVGLAAGFDKGIKFVRPAWALGFGFTEVGTITKYAQKGNERPRMFRYPDHEALVNRMGFNNIGMDEAALRLVFGKGNTRMKFYTTFPLGFNFGKSRNTPLPLAPQEYADIFHKVRAWIDYGTINVSSPNTPGLRKLQGKRELSDIVSAVQEMNHGRMTPILLKIAPDLTPYELDDVVDVVFEHGADGIIATNTSIDKRNISEENGGLSGKPIEKKATEVVKHLYKTSGGKLHIIGVGGVSDAQGAYDKIKAGATLVQLLTALPYEGPSLPKRINEGLLEFCERDGLKSITEAVGVDVN